MKRVLVSVLMMSWVGLTFSGCSSTDSTGPTIPTVTDGNGDGQLEITVIEGTGSSQASTIITYALPRETHVFLEVQNATGYNIAVLVNEVQPPGTHEVEWDAVNREGEPVGEGVIYFHIVTADFEAWWAGALVR